MKKGNAALTGLALLLCLLLFAAMLTGAFRIPLGELSVAWWSGNDLEAYRQELYVLKELRIPRVFGSALVGALLGGAGMAMQGLFRNPLADPGLIGVSSGAALFAVVALFFGVSSLSSVLSISSVLVLPLMAFGGALLAALLAYRLSLVGGRTMLGLLLLVGICIQFFAGALTSIFVFASDDESLRSITFWLMGGFAGIGQHTLLVLTAIVLPVLTLLWRLHRELDIMTIGEMNAEACGVDLKRTRQKIVILSSLGLGVSVAISGVVGFIGLAAPHIARLLLGHRHRISLPAAMLIGAILATFSDLIARTILEPREIPVGIITALFGTPFILTLLLRARGKIAMGL